jgi:hypothetical protein
MHLLLTNQLAYNVCKILSPSASDPISLSGGAKMNYFVILSLFIIGISASADDSSLKIYYYKINVKNATLMQDGYVETDLVPIRTAAVIKENQPESCIDLHLLFTQTDDNNLLDVNV